MYRRFQLRAVAVAIHRNLLKIPNAVKEPLTALDGSGIPGGRLLKIADEHLIKPHGIRAVFIDNIVRVYNVSAGFAHLLAVFTQNHAVARALLVGLLSGHHTDIIKEFMPEAAVEQVERGMFHAAVIPIHRRPVFKRFLGGKRFIIMRIAIAQEIPGGPRPLRHGVRFAHSLSAAVRAGGIHPIRHLGKRRFSRFRRLIGIHHWQLQRKLILRHRYISALRTVDDRNRFSPVTLT